MARVTPDHLAWSYGVMALWWAVTAIVASWLFLAGLFILTFPWGGDLRTGATLMILSAVLCFILAMTGRKARQDKWPN